MLGVSIFDAPAQAFRFHPGPDLQFGGARRRDQPRAARRRKARCSRRWRSGRFRRTAQTRPLPDPFFVIATQNPVEQIGAYPLPESQLDRFLMAIELGYPDPAAERELLTGGDRRAQIATLTPLADPPTLLEWQREAAAVHVAPALLDYVQALLAATRGNVGSGADAGARRGLSPRAGTAAARRGARVGAARRPADGGARRRAGGVPVGRRPSARRRRTRGRAAGAVAAARGRAALTGIQARRAGSRRCALSRAR